MIQTPFKIGIIGGGPAAVAAALKLKQYNFEVLLFEATDFNHITIGEHLAAEAIHEFSKLGIPKSILTKHSIPCTEVQNAWGYSDIHFNESIFNPFGAGFILSRPDIDAALCTHCVQQGIEVYLKTPISKIEKSKSGWSLFHGNTHTQVDFVIDASGRNSKFNFASISKKVKEDGLIGITKHVTPSTDTTIKHSHLLVESTKNGWWYTVQVASGIMISTFMTDAKILQSSKLSSSDFWDQALSNSTSTKERVQAFTIPNTSIVKSAHSQLAKEMYGTNWLKVGDAAQSFDPLSSAGILKGIKMGQLAADAIQKQRSGSSNAFTMYKEEINHQHTEYLQQKAAYYAKETRWLHYPFWYQRNFLAKNIQQFSIVPLDEINIQQGNLENKITFLQTQLPEINLHTLLNCIQQNNIVKNAITMYLKETNATQMSPWLLHALESLKIVGVVSVAKKKVENY